MGEGEPVMYFTVYHSEDNFRLPPVLASATEDGYCELEVEAEFLYWPDDEEVEYQGLNWATVDGTMVTNTEILSSIEEHVSNSFMETLREIAYEEARDAISDHGSENDDWYPDDF
jgi:hypothetical protein